MKTQIYVFTGFLSSGKTSLINEILKENINSKEKIVLIQCESGEEETLENILKDKNIVIHKLDKGQSRDKVYMENIIQENRPKKIIIEQNGMNELVELLDILSHKDIRKHAIIHKIINIIDCRRFHMLMGIVSSTLISQKVF